VLQALKEENFKKLLFDSIFLEEIYKKPNVGLNIFFVKLAIAERKLTVRNNKVIIFYMRVYFINIFMIIYGVQE
jgi:hypothetical protein